MSAKSIVLDYSVYIYLDFTFHSRSFQAKYFYFIFYLPVTSKVFIFIISFAILSFYIKLYFFCNGCLQAESKCFLPDSLHHRPCGVGLLTYPSHQKTKSVCFRTHQKLILGFIAFRAPRLSSQLVGLNSAAKFRYTRCSQPFTLGETLLQLPLYIRKCWDGTITGPAVGMPTLSISKDRKWRYSPQYLILNSTKILTSEDTGRATVAAWTSLPNISRSRKAQHLTSHWPTLMLMFYAKEKGSEKHVDAKQIISAHKRKEWKIQG